MSKTKKRLLFVCLGNICRSPAAEGVMKSIVKTAGMEDEFVIDSAGIGDWHIGQLPDHRMRKHGAQRGYQFDSRARQFNVDDFANFDHIYVMDHENKRMITAMAATEEDGKKVEMLASYLKDNLNVDVVPDPYYGEDQDFKYALDLIEIACKELFIQLQGK